MLREKLHTNQSTKDTLVRGTAHPQSVKGSVQVGRESRQKETQTKVFYSLPLSHDVCSDLAFGTSGWRKVDFLGLIC